LIATKNFLIVIIATIAVSVAILLNPIDEDNDDHSNFTLDAVYLEADNSILITFSDQNNKSSFAVLEILGMETTYHKEFQITDSKFSHIVPLEKLPRYGWKTIPLTLEITYDEFEIINMKTEIHDEDQPSPEIIFG
tara:strand:+ start:117 stop:524 length:408 start_codon:yes stop_codon:yes gene_type:complete